MNISYFHKILNKKSSESYKNGKKLELKKKNLNDFEVNLEKNFFLVKTTLSN